MLTAAPDVLDEGSDPKTDYRERVVWTVAILAITPLVLYALQDHRWAQFTVIQYAFNVLVLSIVCCKDRYSLRRARVRVAFLEYLPIHLCIAVLVFCCQLEWFQWQPLMPVGLTRGPLSEWLCGLVIIAFVYAGVGILQKRLDQTLAQPATARVTQG
jgi:hypothetical protein